MDDLQFEALRYMGARGFNDSLVQDMVRQALDLLQSRVTPRLITRRVEVVWDEHGTPWIDGLCVPGKDATRLLAGCAHAVILAATLGTQADAMIRFESVRAAARGMAFSAAASAYLEARLDEFCASLCASEAARGLYATARFSPGYGDMPLSLQNDLLGIVNANQIGLFLTKGGMLAPEKSVTAIIGLGATGAAADTKGCVRCGMKRCAYREGNA